MEGWLALGQHDAAVELLVSGLDLAQVRALSGLGLVDLDVIAQVTTGALPASWAIAQARWPRP